jgi:hypothetical protein
MSTSESPETPSFEQLPLTPTFSPPQINSSLKTEINQDVHIELDQLEEILAHTKANMLNWTPMQVGNYLVTLWKLPHFMAKDIQHFCIETKLSGKKLLGLNDEGLLNLGFNNLWTSQLMLSLELIFKHFPDKLPLNKLCKTLQPKYHLSLKKSQKAKLSTLKRMQNDLPTPIQEIFGEVENEFPWSKHSDDLDSFEEVDQEEEEEEFFEENSSLLKPFGELEYNLERHFKLTQILKPLTPFRSKSRSNDDKGEHWINIMDQVIYDYWWVWLGIGGLISYRLMKPNSR